MTNHVIVSVSEIFYKEFAQLIRGERKGIWVDSEGGPVATLIKFGVLYRYTKHGKLSSDQLRLGENAPSTWGFHDGANGYFLVVSVE